MNKKLLAIMCVGIILISGCVQKENTGSLENIDESEKGVNQIVNFTKKYGKKERPKETTPPEELPEGIPEYDDESVFRFRKTENLTYVDYFPTEYTYQGISVIYEGDVPKQAYESATEWLSVLYEANKLGSEEKMRTNIEHRYNLLRDSCKTFVKSNVIDEHIESMYHFNDAVSCALSYKSENKVDFYGYKTAYTDFQNVEYYGITAEIWFDTREYTKVRQVPNYIEEHDMPFQFCVEIIFDSDNKIAGWQEQFVSHSSKKNRSDYFIVSPERAEYATENPYLGVVFDYSFKEDTVADYFKSRDAMFDFEKKLLYILNDNTEFTEETFAPLIGLCDERFVNSETVRIFFDEFLYDIKKYNVDFEFDPFTLKSFDDNKNINIRIYEDTKYGDVYHYAGGGLIKTGSKEFNEKYCLYPDGYRFQIDYYFVIKDETPKLLGIMMERYNTLELSEILPEALVDQWNGIERPIVEEEQG